PSGAGANGTHGGGFGGQVTVSSAVKSALQANAGTYRWVLATSGSQSAAGIELATGEPVMAIGGFSGEGGNLSLAQFERYVAAGEIHYYSASGGGGPGGGNSTNAITTWVKAHYKTVTIGGETFYDLTSPLS
ncbi:MAG: mannosyltransferase YkcB-related protein, partial [Solirubrobacteraceae bacterium]